jgi:hypothetical protein
MDGPSKIRGTGGRPGSPPHRPWPNVLVVLSFDAFLISGTGGPTLVKEIKPLVARTGRDRAAEACPTGYGPWAECSHGGNTQLAQGAVAHSSLHR